MSNIRSSILPCIESLAELAMYAMYVQSQPALFDAFQTPLDRK